MNTKYIIVLLLLKVQCGNFGEFAVVILKHNVMYSTTADENTSNESVVSQECLSNNSSNSNSWIDLKFKIFERGKNGKTRVVGGETVETDTAYPYQAMYGSFCGAAILDKVWAITAAHCRKQNWIIVGSRFLYKGKMIRVKSHYFHPKWAIQNKKHPIDYDFLLLKLSEKLKFDSTINAIPLGSKNDLAVGNVITVTGWGAMGFMGPQSEVLQEVKVPIIAKKICQQVTFPNFQGSLTKRMFCAGYKDGLKDACQGDSGGPAVVHNRLVGLVSFGYECATPDSFGVYADVVKVKSWILETIEQK